MGVMRSMERSDEHGFDLPVLVARADIKNAPLLGADRNKHTGLSCIRQVYALEVVSNV